MATCCGVVDSSPPLAVTPVGEDMPLFSDKEFDFVERPSQDFFCPVSLELLLEPQLTSCCGHHLSLEVAKRLQKEGKSCPMCNAESWSAMLDKYHRRRVHEVRVRCWNKDRGCGWMGEVNELKRHDVSCDKRPWECKYCGLQCTYGEGEGKHWSGCLKFPEPCPNGCEVGSVERCGVEEHRSVCPLEPVACKMKEFGCSVVLPRKELAAHVRESGLQHLTAMTALNLHLTRQLQHESAERDKKIAQLLQDSAERDRKLEQLKQNSREMQEELKALSTVVNEEVKSRVKHIEEHTCPGCTVFEFNNYQYNKEMAEKDDWTDSLSDKFYSYKSGYAFKLQIRYYEAKYSDIGAFLLLVEGEHDDELHWPVKVSVTLELINQAGDNHQGLRKCKVLEWGKGQRYEKSINDTVIEYAEMEKTRDNVQYLVNDCFKFRISLLVM